MEAFPRLSFLQARCSSGARLRDHSGKRLLQLLREGLELLEQAFRECGE